MSDLPIGVPIYYFHEGYNVFDGGSCIDLPIAIAAGREEKENYYYYLALLSTNKSWGSEKNFYQVRKKILAQIGIEFVEYEFKSFECMLDTFISLIKKETPVLLPVTYSAMFYDLGYHLPVGDIGHAILLTGYNEENGQIQIGDANLVSHGLNPQNKHYNFYETRIPTCYLEDIWNYSSNIFSKSSSDLYHKFYAFINSGSQENDINLRVSRLLDLSMLKSNRLAHLIQRNDDKKEDSFFHIYVRRDLLGHMKPFFDYLSLQAEKISPLLKDDILEIETEYLTNRNKIISRWHADSLKGNIPEKSAYERANRVIDMDNQLLFVLRDKFINCKW